MTKHTPAPWELKNGYEQNNGAEGCYIVANDKNEILLCCEQNLLTEADYHLIAAAPELLDALKSVQHIVNGHAFSDKVEMVNKAIAKAEGK